MSTQHTRKIIQFQFLGLTIAGVFSSLSGIVIIVLALVAGPVFCGWICPFGLVQDLLIKIRKIIGIKPVSLKNHGTLKYSRFLLLALSFVNASYILQALFSNDPRSIFHQLLTSRSLSYLNIGVLAVFLIGALFIDRFFCRYLCPEGAKQSAIGIGRVFKIERSDQCVNCGKCNRTCPMGIHVTKEVAVNDVACISCMECVTCCPVKGAIHIKARPNKNKMLATLALSALLVIIPTFILSSSALSEPIEVSTLTEGQTLSEGSARGFKSTIQVQVLQNQGQIEDILIIGHSDDAQWFNSASQVVDKMIQAQSTDVDTISGATYSSQGIINATKAALGESFEEQVVVEGHGRRHH